MAWNSKNDPSVALFDKSTAVLASFMREQGVELSHRERHIVVVSMILRLAGTQLDPHMRASLTNTAEELTRELEL